MISDNINTIESTLFDFESYQDENLFFWDEEKINQFQKKYIAQIFEHHYKNCIPYRKYCDFCNMSPSLLKESDNLSIIPQIPTVIFKNIDLLSVPENEIVKRCTSSGTQGLISNIYRDELTIDRLLCSISVGVKDLYELDQDKFVVANLGPDTDEAGDIWFTYITSIVDLISETHYFVRDGELLNEELYKFILNYNSDKKLVLLGPPIMFKYFLDYLKENNLYLKLRQKDLVITAGGWKKYSGEKIERNLFEDMIEQYLNLDKEKIYDSFNQVELNTVIFECKCKRKHIPPWIKVIVRDPITMQDVGENTLGVLSYLDASSASYPCFVLSDDLGKVSSKCSCGRTGQTLEIVRRVNRVETKGCAIKIDSKILKGKSV